jgi:hypothetical protein
MYTYIRTYTHTEIGKQSAKKEKIVSRQLQCTITKQVIKVHPEQTPANIRCPDGLAVEPREEQKLRRLDFKIGGDDGWLPRGFTIPGPLKAP